MTNLTKNIRATSGKKMGLVALVVWEIWPVEVEKGGFFMFFPFCIRLFKLMGYSCLLGGGQSQGKC